MARVESVDFCGEVLYNLQESISVGWHLRVYNMT